MSFAACPASTWRRLRRAGRAVSSRACSPAASRIWPAWSRRSPRTPPASARSFGEGVGTDHVMVFFHTSEHDRGSPQRSVSTLVILPEATNDTVALVKAAIWGLRQCWRDGYRYSKAGVITVDLVPLEGSQRALIGALDREKGGAIMVAMDACNKRWSRGAVVSAAAGFAPRRKWSTKFQMRSPRYTTRVEEVPVVRAA